MDLVDECLGVLTGLAQRVFPIEDRDVIVARDPIDRFHLGARDALHVAVMQRRGIERILSFDTHFDRVDGIERVSG